MATITRSHGPALTLAATYAVVLGLVGLWPRHVDASLSVADWAVTRAVAGLVNVTPVTVVATAEVVANAVLFIPVGLAVALWWPRASVRAAALVALGIAAAIEWVQWIAPVDRTPSVVDVVANTAGACVGFAALRVAAARPRYREVILGSLGVSVLGVMAVLVWGLTTSP